MEPVKITHILQDGTLVDSMKNVNIPAEIIPLAVKKAIYEMIMAAQ